MRLRLTTAVRCALLAFMALQPVLACHSGKPLVMRDDVPVHEGLAYSDGAPDAGLDGLPVPRTVQPWQKVPPCNEAMEEHAINGACWQATPRIPPCGQLREWKGACYRPIARARPQPVSGQ